MVLKILANGRTVETFLDEIGGFLAGAANAGGEKNISADIKTKLKNSLEKTSNISREMMIEAVNNLTNNIVNNVSQKNSASLSNMVSQYNIISLTDSTIGGDMNIIGNTSTNTSSTDTTGIINQTQDSNIKTDISTSIIKNITNSLPNAEEQHQASLKKMMDDSIQKLQESLETANYNTIDPKSLIDGLNTGIAGTVNVDIEKSTEIEQNIKDVLNLNEDFKVYDENNLENNISNIIDQNNFASCLASTVQRNEINLRNLDITGNVNIKDNIQKNIAKSLMTCVIDQTITNEISNKIVTQIESNISRMFDAVADQAPENLPLLVDMYDAANKSIVTSSEYNEEEIPEKIGDLIDNLPVPENNENNTNSNNTSGNNQSENNIPEEENIFAKYKIPIIIGVISLILLIIIIISTKKSSNNYQPNYYQPNYYPQY